MKTEINHFLKTSKAKTFLTEDLLSEMKRNPLINIGGAVKTQMEFQQIMLELVGEGLIKAVSTKQLWRYNSKLAKKYKILKEDERMTAEEIKGIMAKFHPLMVMKYYYGHKEQFAKDEYYLRCISDYLYRNKRDKGMTINERSVDVFKDEKYLDKYGESLLKRVGLEGIKSLNCYRTSEPFMYFNVFVQKVQNAIVIENKDTYDSFVKLLVEGSATYFDVDFQMVIFGEGKKIVSSLKYLEILKLEEINIYYYGDFDKTGFQIYDSLVKKYGFYNIQLFKPMYEALWKRKLDIPQKNEQNVKREDYVALLQEFEEKEEMIAYLDKHHYIPQECTNIVVLREISLNGIK